MRAEFRGARDWLDRETNRRFTGSRLPSRATTRASPPSFTARRRGRSTAPAASPRPSSSTPKAKPPSSKDRRHARRADPRTSGGLASSPSTPSSAASFRARVVAQRQRAALLFTSAYNRADIVERVRDIVLAAEFLAERVTERVSAVGLGRAGNG
ncbi:MAG: hypothetical protein MZV70_05460 [Desulfobacterales bacterium]|nr:hypothetical protein [Desulfobacterales bacterium]